MATITYIKETRQAVSAMKGVIAYCLQEKKVLDDATGQRMVSGIHCDGENAFVEFMATKAAYQKTDGTTFYHYVQSFSPAESITPQEAHSVAREFAERAWRGHEILVATHCDAGHLHSHFVVNSVSFEDGRKLRQSPNTLQTLRHLSDEICAAHGLSVLPVYENSGGNLSAREYHGGPARGSDELPAEGVFPGEAAGDPRADCRFAESIPGTGASDFPVSGEPDTGFNIADGEPRATGWEESRKEFERFLGKGYAVGDSHRPGRETPELENVGSHHSHIDTGIGIGGSAVRSAVYALAALSKDEEDPEERRQRIEAQENGEAIGTALGLAAGLLSELK